MRWDVGTRICHQWGPSQRWGEDPLHPVPRARAMLCCRTVSAHRSSSVVIHRSTAGSRGRFRLPANAVLLSADDATWLQACTHRDCSFVEGLWCECCTSAVEQPEPGAEQPLL